MGELERRQFKAYEQLMTSYRASKERLEELEAAILEDRPRDCPRGEISVKGGLPGDSTLSKASRLYNKKITELQNFIKDADEAFVIIAKWHGDHARKGLFEFYTCCYLRDQDRIARENFCDPRTFLNWRHDFIDTFTELQGRNRI